MISRRYEFHDGEKGTALAVRIKLGRGDSNFFKVLKDGTVVIRLKQGNSEVNTQLIDFISREFKIPKKSIQVIAGENGNNKLISIVDMKPKQIQKLILDKLD